MCTNGCVCWADRREGKLTKESDRAYIEVLLAVAQNCRAWKGSDGRSLDLEGGTTHTKTANWSMPRAVDGKSAVDPT